MKNRCLCEFYGAVESGTSLGGSLRAVARVVYQRNQNGMREGATPSLSVYLLALLATAAAVAARWLLDPWLAESLPLVTLFGAVAVAVWHGGYRPAVLATVIGYLACSYLFIRPRGSISLTNAQDLIGLIAYLVTCAIIISLGEVMWTARHREKDRADTLRVTLASIGDGVIVTNAEGAVTFFNSVAESLTGWKPEEAQGRPLKEVFRITNEETGEEVQNPALRAMQEGVVFGLANHTMLIAKDGSARPIDDSGAPVKDIHGNIIGAVLVFRDITERRKAERAAAVLGEIVRSSEDAIIGKNLDGIISSWNSSAERMFGYAAEEAVGKPITIVIPPERLDEESFILERLRHGQRVEHFETVRVSKSGEPLDISLTVSPIRDASGRIIGASKIARDITKRKHAEEAIRQQHELLRVTLSSIGDAVITTDSTGVITFLNPVAEFLTKWPRQEAEGRPLDEVFKVLHETTRSPVENPALRAINEGVVAGLANHSVLIARDATETPIDDSGAPIRDVDGKVVGAVLIFRDVTERRRVEEERAEILAREKAAREQAESASRAKDEFVAMVSHELRAPLNAILGWSQLLRNDGIGQADLHRALDVIERNSKRQVQLIEDLLDISRAITGKLVLQFHPTEIGKIIEAAVESVRAAANAKSIQLEVHLDPRGSWVIGDSNRLQQVFWNLLSNAVKFTPSPGCIELRVDRIDSLVQISVRDSGPGISAEFLPYIFDRFTQSDTTSNRKHGGLGLGLAIVRHLVELHGGSVQAESPGDGLGSVFRVTLPLSTEHEKEYEQVSGRMPDSLSVGLNVLEGVRVMIVDDERDTRDVLSAMLHDSGAQVRTCASVEAALEVIRQWRPSVLISDLAMPDEDGYSLIRRLRSMDAEQGGDIPAAALTGYAKSEDRTRVLAAGFQMHIPKPIEAAELITVIASLVGRTGKQREPSA